MLCKVQRKFLVSSIIFFKSTPVYSLYHKIMLHLFPRVHNRIMFHVYQILVVILKQCCIEETA